MSCLLKKVQDEMVDEKNIYKQSINTILVPGQRYQDSRHLLQNPKVSRNVMGFINRVQRFTGSSYLYVDSPFGDQLDQYYLITLNTAEKCKQRRKNPGYGRHRIF